MRMLYDDFWMDVVDACLRRMGCLFLVFYVLGFGGCVLGVSGSPDWYVFAGDSLRGTQMRVENL